MCIAKCDLLIVMLGKFQGIESQQQEVAAKEEQIAELEAALREKTLENEVCIHILGYQVEMLPN